MRFVKENPALAAGIGLPFLLVLLFSLATIIPQWLVAPPQYDVIFTVRGYKCKNGAGNVNFMSVGGNIKAKYSYPENNTCSYSQEIYRFSAKNLTSKEITFEIPAKNEDSKEWKEFEIEELKSLEIDNSPVAPDGYIFNGEGKGYSHGMFWFGYRTYNGISINKNGRKISISPVTSEQNYSYSAVDFLGWVVSEEGEKQ